MLNPTNRTGLSTHISVTTHTKPKRTDEKGKKSPKFMHLPIVQTHKHTEATSTDTVIPKQTAIFILSISHFYALFLYQQSCLFVGAQAEAHTQTKSETFHFRSHWTIVSYAPLLHRLPIFICWLVGSLILRIHYLINWCTCIVWCFHSVFHAPHSK